jgi:hypothetical protein
MTHSTPSRIDIRRRGRIAMALGAVLAVSACSETGEFMFGSRDAAANPTADIGATRLVERDVEAPEVFDVTEEGLWDGRPSLGGVWVAHPAATDPERVIIRHAETGRFVIGALFRRERENPGPVIQISSDAAAALDILAGAPTLVQVTALRREEVPDTPEAAETPDLAGAVPPGDEAEAAPAEAAALPEIEAAALPGPEAATAPEPRGAPEAVEVAALPEPAELPPRAMTAEQIAAGIRSAGGAAQPQDPIAAAAVAAIAEAEATQTAAAAPAAAPPRAASLDRPYVQIGIFSVEDNAAETGEALRSAGLVPTIYDQTSNGRRFWRVVVGPAPNAEDRAAVLETARGLGFEDAYYVTR